MQAFQLKMIGSVILALAFSTASAEDAQTDIDNAKDKSSETEEVAVMEEVIVIASPIRDSQEAAIIAKLEADNVLDVISADTIGRFPDQNLADSLGRVPGMAIERDQGQARYINFRGMPFRYTAIGFNGIDVPGAENGRIPRFDSFPSVITSKVEVNKAILPSMTSEAVAGYVNIETFNPFDIEGFTLDVDYGSGEQDLGGGDISKASFRTSYSGENFGFMLFASQNSREQVTDNHEYDLETVDGQILVNQLQKRSYKLKREDESYGAHLEYRNEDGNLKRVFLSSLHSEFIDLEQRNHYQFNFVNPVPGNTAENTPMYIDQLLEYGRYDNSTATNTLGADLMLGDWQIDLRYNATETEFNTQLPIIYNSGVNFITGSASLAMGGYDINNILNPIVTLAAPLTDYNYAASYAYKIDWPLNVDSDKYKLDANKDFEMGNLQVGLQLDTRKAKGAVATHFDVFAFDPTYSFQTDGANDPLNIGSFLTDERWHSNSSNSIDAYYYDNIALRQAWEQYGNVFPEPSDDQLIAIDEEITSAYAMMNSAFSWGNLIYGFRVEKTDYTSAGTLDGEAVTISDSFTNVLPSLHANFDINDKMKARLSASTGINRPTYIEWRAAASIDPTEGTVSGGNPTLKAEESWGVDASFEYYFAPASLLSVGAFARYIDKVIYEDVSLIDAGVYGSTYAGQEWELEGYVNGTDGKLTGIEVNFIGQAGEVFESLDGFGVNLNATLLNGEFSQLDGTVSQLPGTSDLLWNASLFYENHGLSIRLNYQYRDEWVSPIESPDEVWGEQERVDMNILYQLPLDWNESVMSVYFNANNLTDETDVRYGGNGLVNQAESYGRRYLLGMRFSY